MPGRKSPFRPFRPNLLKPSILSRCFGASHRPRQAKTYKMGLLAFDRKSGNLGIRSNAFFEKTTNRSPINGKPINYPKIPQNKIICSQMSIKPSTHRDHNEQFRSEHEKSACDPIVQNLRCGSNILQKCSTQTSHNILEESIQLADPAKKRRVFCIKYYCYSRRNYPNSNGGNSKNSSWI